MLQIDAQLEFFLKGQIQKYKGLLNKSEHLSNFERWFGRHGEYDENWIAKYIDVEGSKHESLEFSLRSLISLGSLMPPK